MIPKVTRKIKRLFFTKKDNSSSYIHNCYSVTFDDYCRNVDPFTQTNNNKSFFNDIEFGSSPKSMQKKLGKPIFTKKQDSVTILVTKRKVASFLYFSNYSFLFNQKKGF